MGSIQEKQTLFPCSRTNVWTTDPRGERLCSHKYEHLPEVRDPGTVVAVYDLGSDTPFGRELFLRVEAEYEYTPETRGRGPSYSCAGEPGEGAYADITSVRASFCVPSGEFLEEVSTITGGAFKRLIEKNGYLLDSLETAAIEYEEGY